MKMFMYVGLPTEEDHVDGVVLAEDVMEAAEKLCDLRSLFNYGYLISEMNCYDDVYHVEAYYLGINGKQKLQWQYYAENPSVLMYSVTVFENPMTAEEYMELNGKENE